MRVFLTGATGYVGSAALDALVRAGHEVMALVRDPATVELLSRRSGVVPVLGELSTPKSYVKHVEACDGTIHTALESSKRNEAVDRQALDTLLQVARKIAGLKRARAPFFV
jgi:uncharacterized protein YbjT (DUF2867 family)